jgi:FkbM family methyltransferase
MSFDSSAVGSWRFISCESGESRWDRRGDIEFVYPINSTDAIVNDIREGLIQAPYTIDFIQFFVEDRSGYILDVGCHIGTYSLPLARDGYNVIAVDGCKESIECLNESIIRNKLSNLTTIHTPVSDRERTCSFDTQTNCGSTINLEGNSIRTTTIDSILDGKDCSFIKLDIEGHESNAIEGSLKTLEKCQPPLLIEINNHLLERDGSDPREIFVRLDELSYEIFLCYSNFELRPVRPTDVFPYCVVDVLCLHKSYDKSKLTIKEFCTDQDIQQILGSPKMDSPCYNYFSRITEEMR